MSHHTPSAIDPVRLAEHYTAFVRPGRILLTGHSHQAWPDAARAGVLAAWNDAAERVDGKWEQVFRKGARIRRYIAEQIGAEADDIALAPNTHELVCRFLSALPLGERPHLVTTAGEFHSIARQLRRLEEAGIAVTRVPVEPIATLSARLAEAITSNTAAVLASTVLFQTATRVPDLSIAVQAAHDRGAAVLLDAYHGFGAFPFCINDYGVDPIFMVSGGYKYAQWGEGACWMRVPPKCTLRPVFTGWFSDFEHLASPRSNGLIGYGRTGADRFAGSTFEPTSWYRAAAVIEFFEAQRLTLPRLRALSLQQTAHIIDRLAPHFELLTPTAPERRGGFVAVRTARAGELVQTLRQRSIFVDSRADILRLGPAPYVDLGAIDVAIDHLLAVCQTPK